MPFFVVGKEVESGNIGRKVGKSEGRKVGRSWGTAALKRSGKIISRRAIGEASLYAEEMKWFCSAVGFSSLV